MKNQNEETESQKKSIEIKTVADVVRPNWLPGIEPDKKYILVGLHCCGDLSSVLSQLAVDKIEIVGIVLVPCCYHHLTEVVDLSEEKIPNIKSQFVTGIGRGLEENKLVTTEVDNPEQTYIGLDTKLIHFSFRKNCQMAGVSEFVNPWRRISFEYKNVGVCLR